MLKIFLSYIVAAVMITSTVSFAGNNGNSKDVGNTKDKDTSTPAPVVLVPVAPVVDINSDKKGENCDPTKVDKVHNKCQCDPSTHEWVMNECLARCDGGLKRIGKFCQKDCTPGQVAFNGGCVTACAPVTEILDSTGKCIKSGHCVGSDCLSQCADGQILMNGRCVEKCGNTSELIGVKCYEKCGNYYERVGTACFEKCGNTKERVGEECMDKCGNSKERVGHDCRDKCKDGYKRDDAGSCISCPFDSVAKK